MLRLLVTIVLLASACAGVTASFDPPVAAEIETAPPDAEIVDGTVALPPPPASAPTASRVEARWAAGPEPARVFRPPRP